jgi:GAF domain-containing protein
VCTIAAGEASSLLFGLNIEIGTGASGWTIASRMPLLNGNAATEFGHVEEAPAGFPLRSSLSIPLESEFGPLGVLTLYGRQPNSFQTSHLRALLAVGSRFAYQMNIDRLGSTREELGLSCQSDGTTGTQLAQLSAAIESESALSTQLQLHGT